MSRRMCPNEDDCIYPKCGLSCRCDDDGYCDDKDCPQIRDGEPAKSGRSCPWLCGGCVAAA